MEEDPSQWLGTDLSPDELQALALQSHNALGQAIVEIQQHTLRVAGSLCGKSVTAQSLELELSSSLAMLPRRAGGGEETPVMAERLLQLAQAAAVRTDHVSAAHSIAAARKLVGDGNGNSVHNPSSYTSLPGSSAPTPDSVLAPLAALHERLVVQNTAELQRACMAGAPNAAARSVEALVVLLSPDKAAAVQASAIMHVVEGSLHASVCGGGGASQAASAALPNLVQLVCSAAEALAPHVPEASFPHLAGSLPCPAFGKIAEALIAQEGVRSAPLLVSIALRLAGAVQLGAAEGGRQLSLQALLSALWRTHAPWLQGAAGALVREALDGSLKAELVALRSSAQPRVYEVPASASGGAEAHYGGRAGGPSVKVLASAFEGGRAIQGLLGEGLLDGLEGLQGEVWREVGGSARRYAHALQEVMREVVQGEGLLAGNVVLASLYYLLACVRVVGRGEGEAAAAILELEAGMGACVDVHRSGAMGMLGTSLLAPLGMQPWGASRAILKRDAPVASHPLRHMRLISRVRGVQKEMADACTVAVLSDLAPALVGVFAQARPSRQNMGLYITDVNFAVAMLQELLESIHTLDIDTTHVTKHVSQACDTLLALGLLKAAPLNVVEALVLHPPDPSLFPPSSPQHNACSNGDSPNDDRMDLATPMGKQQRPSLPPNDDPLHACSHMTYSDRLPWGDGGAGPNVMRVIFSGNLARGVVATRAELADNLFPPLSEADTVVAARLKVWLEGGV